MKSATLILAAALMVLVGILVIQSVPVATVFAFIAAALTLIATPDWTRKR